MTAKKKRNGRVTPKGTANPTPKKKPGRSVGPESDDDAPTHLPGKVHQPQRRTPRPMTNHRGNR